MITSTCPLPIDRFLESCAAGKSDHREKTKLLDTSNGGKQSIRNSVSVLLFRKESVSKNAQALCSNETSSSIPPKNAKKKSDAQTYAPALKHRQAREEHKNTAVSHQVPLEVCNK